MLKVRDRSRIIAHRGIWIDSHDANTSKALTEALLAGFGIETDIRDWAGNLVISHDPPLLDGLLFSDLLTQWRDQNILKGRMLALNVKSDGLIPMLTHLRPALGESDHFFFDMSFPQMLAYSRAGLPISPRISEFEPTSVSLMRELDMTEGYWLDGFDSDWWIGDENVENLIKDYRVTVVSPEIHGRDPVPVWDWFAQRLSEGCHLYLCTDLPFKALERFS